MLFYTLGRCFFKKDLLYFLCHMKLDVCLFLFRWYLTRELTWHNSIFHKALKDEIITTFLKRSFLERACVPVLLRSTKQGNYWYHLFFHLKYNMVLWLSRAHLGVHGLRDSIQCLFIIVIYSTSFLIFVPIFCFPFQI